MNSRSRTRSRRARPDRHRDQVDPGRQGEPADAYARIERDEAWLIGAHIAPFEQGNRYNHEPKRDPQAPPAPLRDRRAARRDEGEGPDARPAPAVPDGKGRAKLELGLARGKQPTTGAGTSPIATPRRDMARELADAQRGP
jgi:SsrA-binding protein